MAWKASSFMSTMAPSAGLAASMDGYHAASAASGKCG